MKQSGAAPPMIILYYLLSWKIGANLSQQKSNNLFSHFCWTIFMIFKNNLYCIINTSVWNWSDSFILFIIICMFFFNYCPPEYKFKNNCEY